MTTGNPPTQAETAPLTAIARSLAEISQGMQILHVISRQLKGLREDLSPLGLCVKVPGQPDPPFQLHITQADPVPADSLVQTLLERLAAAEGLALRVQQLEEQLAAHCPYLTES